MTTGRINQVAILLGIRKRMRVIRIMFDNSLHAAC